jgi:parvulin-like peptidyl-prolyl isomerase
MQSLHLRHILLQHKYEIEDAMKALAGGASFQELAKKRSICSSARAGGDLGQVNEKKVDPDFWEAALALKPGERSGIVRTRFGYHLIERVS